MNLFVEWLSLPEELREPKTQKEFGKDHGIHQTTLSRWKANRVFQDRVVATVKGNLALSMPKYMANLEKLASRDDIVGLAAIKLFVLYAAGWSERFEKNQDREPNSFNAREMAVFINGKPAESLPVGLVSRKSLEVAA